MYATTITNTDINNNSIASLPTRPTASASFGGNGYSAAEMKEAFDKLPRLIIEQFNNLILDIKRTDDEALTACIPTTIYPDHTLLRMMKDIPSGEFAGYLKVGEESLANAIANIYSQIEEIKIMIYSIM